MDGGSLADAGSGFLLASRLLRARDHEGSGRGPAVEGPSPLILHLAVPLASHIYRPTPDASKIPGSAIWKEAADGLSGNLLIIVVVGFLLSIFGMALGRLAKNELISNVASGGLVGSMVVAFLIVGGPSFLDWAAHLAERFL